MISLNGTSYESELVFMDALLDKLLIEPLPSFLSARESEEARVRIKPIARLKADASAVA